MSCDKNLSQPHNPIYALALTHTSACSCTTYRGHDERMCRFLSFISCQKDVTEFPLRLEKKKLSNVYTFKSPRLSHAQMNTHAYPQSFCLIHTFTCTCSPVRQDGIGHDTMHCTGIIRAILNSIHVSAVFNTLYVALFSLV